MPLQATSGAASYDAFGGGVPVAANYIEDVFSTWLYTGNGTSQTITNGVDLSGKGGLVWLKKRSATGNNFLVDTIRGGLRPLYSNLTNAQPATDQSIVTAFNSNGFTLGNEDINDNAATYASWTFREQPKFFDVVTYTGNGTAGRTVAHNLGSAPGVIIVKRTDGATNWRVYHRSLGATQYLDLDETNAAASATTIWNDTAPTSTVFSVGTNSGVNASGGTYVAYVFAHNAGGFGLSGTDNVISCGSFAVGGGSDGVVDLGYEPQWVMFKQAQEGGSGNWRIVDNMRGCSTTITSGDRILSANLSSAEADAGLNMIDFTATGFVVKNGSVQGGDPYIYIAIRRGPMRTPTTGTSVLDVETYTGTQVERTITTANTVDLSFTKSRSTSGTRWNWTDRLRGKERTLNSSLTAAEASDSTGYISFAVQTGYTLGAGDTYDVNTSGRTYVSWNFTRAPSVFDEVCYTGTGVTSRALNHNLTVVPEMIICKSRSLGAEHWGVYTATTGIGKTLWLDAQNNVQTLSQRILAVSSSTFTVGDNDEINQSTATYVAYLFATCAGVSKVGGYTGTGTTQVIDCGFTSGARFVLIKRTDSTSDWYVWDSARGIVSGNDPYLLMNSTDAEVTNTDFIDTASSGFEISSTAPAAINASSGAFIFLAIA